MKLSVFLGCFLSFAMYADDFHYTTFYDPIVRAYVDALYANKFASEPLYICEDSNGIFFNHEADESLIYTTTGYVHPRVQFSDTEPLGTFMTYGTCFLMHEVYLEYLLEHPELIIFDENVMTHLQFENDIEQKRMVAVAPYIAQCLSHICKDGTIFVESVQGTYCKTLSSIVKINTEEKVCYIISPLFGQLLFKQVQKEHLIAGTCDDEIYLSRVFNDRSHWTLMSTEEVVFFTEHKDDSGNGGFLCDKQMNALLQIFTGILPELLQNDMLQIYVDVSGFMLKKQHHTMLYFVAESNKKVFIVSPYLIHLISKLHAKKVFISLTPVVVATLKSARTKVDEYRESS